MAVRAAFLLAFVVVTEFPDGIYLLGDERHGTVLRRERPFWFALRPCLAEVDETAPLKRLVEERKES